MSMNDPQARHTQLLAAAEECQALLDQQAPSAAANRRRDPRLHYRTLITVEFQQQLGPAVRQTVVSRDLSATGMAVLVRNFIYPGGQCQAHLLAHGGQTRVCPAVVRWCRHIRGLNHLAGLSWKHPIVPEDFVQPEHLSILFAGDADRARRISGRVIVVSPLDFEAGLVRHMLREARVRVSVVPCPELATTALYSHAADAIVLCHPQNACEMATFVTQVRTRGFSGGIIILSDESSPQAAAALRAAGASFVLSRPCTAEQLLAALSVVLGVQPQKGDAPPADHDLAPLLQQFRAHAAGLADALREGLNSNDAQAVKRACYRLIVAAQFGFAELGEHARELSLQIDTAAGLAGHHAEIRRLATMAESIAA